MARSDIQLTVLGLVNEVERKLSVDVSSTLTTRKLTTLILDFLNDTIAECSDYGDWEEMYREVNVTASSGQGEYKIIASAEIKNIYEISHSSRGVSPLENRPLRDILRLQRIGGNGVPSQYAVVGVSGTRPKFRVFNVPGANQQGTLFTVHFYKKPRLYTTSDASVVVPFPSRMLIMGTYAKALMEETGGQPTQQGQMAYGEYNKMRTEALNRFNSDTDADVRVVPMRGRK